MEFFTQHIIYGLWEQVIKMLCSAGEEPLTHLKITCIYNLFLILFPRWISTWRRKNNTGWVCLCLSVHSVFTEQFILCSHDFWVSCFYFTFLSVGLLFLHCIFLWGLFSLFFKWSRVMRLLISMESPVSFSYFFQKESSCYRCWDHG